MTVERLRAEMGQREFVWWNVYYAKKGQDAELEQRLRGADHAG